MPIAIAPSTQNEILTLALTGVLSGSECEILRKTVAQNLKPETRTLCLDLQELSFVDSTGLGALVGTKVTCCRNGARVVLLSPSPEVMRVLLGANFDVVFDIVEDGALPSNAPLYASCPNASQSNALGSMVLP